MDSTRREKEGLAPVAALLAEVENDAGIPLATEHSLKAQKNAVFAVLSIFFPLSCLFPIVLSVLF